MDEIPECPARLPRRANGQRRHYLRNRYAADYCGVGFAVDYSRANAVKAAMQSALDATALMISKEAATDTAAQLQTNAQKYFLALFTQTQALTPRSPPLTPPPGEPR